MNILLGNLGHNSYETIILSFISIMCKHAYSIKVIFIHTWCSPSKTISHSVLLSILKEIWLDVILAVTTIGFLIHFSFPMISTITLSQCCKEQGDEWQVWFCTGLSLSMNLDHKGLSVTHSLIIKAPEGQTTLIKYSMHTKCIYT